jgi:protein-tyrosine phosphatase
MTSRILFVCLGNICRSPAAEGAFRAVRPDCQTDSAGTSDWHVGEPPYGPMQAAALARGLDLSDLRARQFRTADFQNFDLIIGMDAANLSKVEAMRPPGNTVPVKLFTEFAPAANADFVPDPYYTRNFDSVLNLIQAAAHGLAAHLG